MSLTPIPPDFVHTAYLANELPSLLLLAWRLDSLNLVIRYSLLAEHRSSVLLVCCQLYLRSLGASATAEYLGVAGWDGLQVKAEENEVQMTTENKNGNETEIMIIRQAISANVSQRK